MSTPRVLKVVGLTFVPTYPDNLHRLAQALDQYRPVEGPRREGSESFQVVLVPRPENPHDSNAVEVHVPSLGDQVGHLSRRDAAIVQPVLLEKGRYRLNAWVWQVRIDPEHPENPGLDIAVVRQPVEDTNLL